MKILSWDVGIKNLAFCLIEVFPKNEQRKWSIKDWGIINLVDEGDRTCKCCKKNASLFLPCGGLKFCKIHSRKHELNIKQYNEYFKINQDKKQCCYLINSSKKKSVPCGKNSKVCHVSDNNVDNNYCTAHSKTIYKRYLTTKKYIPLKKINASKESIDILRKKLVAELDKRKHFLECSMVLIENQPALKNPKMKAISSTIYDYFLIRGIVDKEINKSKMELVKYISPSNKLKVADEGDTTKLIKLKGDEAKTYKLTKALGIKYCLKMIEGQETWVNCFNGYKKKDDMADAFLQGMYYIFRFILLE
tara:strand:+ start:2127 stop:3041 length:915 start_codon:yes stop_codon:yes gene_type:complete